MINPGCYFAPHKDKDKPWFACLVIEGVESVRVGDISFGQCDQAVEYAQSVLGGIKFHLKLMEDKARQATEAQQPLVYQPRRIKRG